MLAEGELRSNMDESDRVRDLQDRIEDLKAEVSTSLPRRTLIQQNKVLMFLSVHWFNIIPHSTFWFGEQSEARFLNKRFNKRRISDSNKQFVNTLINSWFIQINKKSITMLSSLFVYHINNCFER